MLHCSLLCTSAYKLKVNKSFQYIYTYVLQYLPHELYLCIQGID